MLVSTPARATAHDFCSDRFAAAWDFLQRADVASLPNGHHVIDGENVYANVMEYDTAPASEKQMEAHRRYYDVHFVAAGAEELWVAPTAALPETQPYDEQNDCSLHAVPAVATRVLLQAGDVAVVAPEEAHMPGCIAGAPAHVKKIVVKVRV